jgi:hypothetical protein
MQLRLLVSAALLSAVLCTQAQNTSPYWSLVGNSNATTSSKLGTTNAIPLRLLTNNVERLRVDATGKLGVGTTAPAAPFDLRSTSGLLARFNGGSQMFMGLYENSTQRGYIGSFAGNAQDVDFGTNTANTSGSVHLTTKAIPRLTIDSAGNVGIGTMAPEARLHFNTATATPLLRGTVDGLTKLYMSSAGGLSIGAGVAAPGNGLYVAGNAGIGTNTPASPLDVVSASATYIIQARSTYSGTNNKTAISAYSVNAPGWGTGVEGTGGHRGVYGGAEGGSSTGVSVGVYGHASGNSGYGARYGVFGGTTGGYNAFGVYGTASGASSFNAAGYFDGAVWARTYNTISDRKFKQDIQAVEDGLEQVLKLRPTTYTFKAAEYKGMHLPEGRQLGLIADEVKEVFPELVEQAVHPAEYDEQDRTKVISPEVTYEGVNYQGLIPVLIASIQEQQRQIIALKAELTALKTQIQDRNSPITVTSAYLEQNIPNPVTGTTTIRYSVPQTAVSARLILTNVKGQLIKTVTLSNRGAGQVSLNTAALAAGTYNYTLHVDGKQADTKRLIIIK